MPDNINIILPNVQFNISSIHGFELFRGHFKCEDWEKVVNVDGKYFEKHCDPNTEGAHLLEEKERVLSVDKKSDYKPPNIEKPPKSESKKLSSGTIAGIIIACIVVVAAIMVGEYFLIMHFKNKKDASKNEAEEV